MNSRSANKLDEIAKRAFDLSASTIGLGAIWPFLVGIAISIKLDSSGPVFYLGRRTGKHGKAFDMLKFRTMVTGAGKIGGPSTGLGDQVRTRGWGS